MMNFEKGTSLAGFPGFRETMAVEISRPLIGACSMLAAMTAGREQQQQELGP